MRGTLEDLRARVATTNTNLNALDKSVQAFIQRNKPTVAVSKNEDTGVSEAHLGGDTTLPRDYAVIIGMIAHNMRATLDGLAYQLATISYGRALPEKIAKDVMFPVSNKTIKAKSGRRFDPESRSVKPIGINFIGRLEEFQPYKFGNKYRSHPLWRLHVLNNTDKHRLLVVVEQRSKSTIVTFPPIKTASEQVGDRQMVQYFSGDLRITAGGHPKRGKPPAHLGPGATGNTNVQVTAVTEMCFGKTPGLLQGKRVIPVLRDISHFVERVVDAFAEDLF